jgi:polyisoprenoid-binding protein YceI
VRSLLATILLGLSSLCAAQGQSSRLIADPALSKVTFSVGSTLHQVHGSFHLQSGAVNFNRHGSQVSGLIVVAAASGDTGNVSRDKRMTSAILEAAKFAEVTFRPTHLIGEIVPSGDSTAQINGVLTLHGTPHDLTVPLEVHIDGNTCTAKSRFTIPYVKWGIKDPGTFILRVDKDVQMEVALVGQLSSVTQQ